MNYVEKCCSQAFDIPYTRMILHALHLQLNSVQYEVTPEHGKILGKTVYRSTCVFVTRLFGILDSDWH